MKLWRLALLVAVALWTAWTPPGVALLRFPVRHSQQAVQARMIGLETIRLQKLGLAAQRGDAPPELRSGVTESELRSAYEHCRRATAQASATFYFGSALLSRAKRKHIWAVYAWCREVDDLVDSTQAQSDPSNVHRQLIERERNLSAIWLGEARDPVGIALGDTVQQFSLPKQPFQEMLEGMAMDTAGGKTRYRTFSELYQYCYRVAGTVGLMTLPILGSNFSPDVVEPAVELGVALQLTNILRDVGEDLQRGRIYLPLEDLEAFGLTYQDIEARIVTPAYVDLIKFEMTRAREYYRSARRGLRHLRFGARFALQTTLDMYAAILDRIERNGFDNFRLRARTSALQKVLSLPRAMIRSIRVPSDGAIATLQANLSSTEQWRTRPSFLAGETCNSE